MSERDTDIEFDFFEDLEPPEPVQEEERPRLRRPGPPGGPRRPGAGSFAPLLRLAGLRGLADTFRRTAGSKDVAGGGVLLAAQAQRLVTSDVVWDDLFRDASVRELKNQGITGVRPPDSSFVSNPDFASSRFWVAIL